MWRLRLTAREIGPLLQSSYCVAIGLCSPTSRQGGTRNLVRSVLLRPLAHTVQEENLAFDNQGQPVVNHDATTNQVLIITGGTSDHFSECGVLRRSYTGSRKASLVGFIPLFGGELGGDTRRCQAHDTSSYEGDLRACTFLQFAQDRTTPAGTLLFGVHLSCGVSCRNMLFPKYLWHKVSMPNRGHRLVRGTYTRAKVKLTPSTTMLPPPQGLSLWH
jgi:hypothetical protein